MSSLRSRKLLERLLLCLVVFALFYGLPNRFKNPARPSRIQQVKCELGAEANLNVLGMGPATQPHIYLPDGLLETNPHGPHPIYELISRAEREWEDKKMRASQTLQEAVIEYKRRYSRRPPKGFDKWWKYVVKNNVQLPDEYDQIHHDLEAFWGMKPAELNKIQEENELKKNSYTIGQSESGSIEVVAYAFEDGRYDDLIKASRKIVGLLTEIESDLPPFRITISADDRPNRLTDHGIRSTLLRAANDQIRFDVASLPKRRNLGWVSACPPESPARQNPINLDFPPAKSPQKTFIYDHMRAMDPCNHPNLFYHHGQFLSHNSGPTPQHVLVPEFSYCSTTLHHNIRIPVPYGWVEDIYPRSDDPDFDDKRDERLLWRGSNTGMFHSSTSRWEYSQRNFLVDYANDIDGTLSVLYANGTRGQRVGEPRKVRKSRVNPAMMDIAFAGEPVSCSMDICPSLKERYHFREVQKISEAGNYKYVLDVDGNGWSGRFKRLMTSNSLIFKSTIYPEWYADRVAPWVHYVPVQVDYSDLHDVLFFFRGDGNGEGAHEQLARTIALAGREWSKTFWRKEDLTAYFFRLILEYTRIMSLDREAMSYRDS